MLHAPEEDTVRVAVHYHSPQRLDVFGDDVYIYPTNAVIEDDGNYKLEVSRLVYYPFVKIYLSAGAQFRFHLAKPAVLSVRVVIPCAPG